jgi:N,N'-diacetyllegionaminate synthase
MKTEIIAEIGQNHNGDIRIAKDLIKAAKQSGADVAKFQVYSARNLFSPKPQNPWFEYNCLTELKRDDVDRLADYCADIGIEFMASVFDLERIEWLEAVDVKRYKLASRSICDRELISGLVATGKPIIVSLGMWNGDGFPDIISHGGVDFLYCVSQYPAPLSAIHLSKVDFGKYAGFSDHTVGITAACASFARGARILEKHLTLDKAAYGPDHACSMIPSELASINIFRNDWWQLK